MKFPNKHIGILGLGSRTTLHYLSEFNRLYQQDFKGYSTCPIKMINTNFDLINPYLPDQFDRLEPITLRYLEALNTMEPDCLVVPNITLHQTIDRLALNPEISGKLIHPVKAMAEAFHANQIDSVVLFGSAYTMNSTYIPEILNGAGVKILLPETKDLGKIDRLRQLVYAGTAELKDYDWFQQLCLSYGDQPVLMACTELSVAAEQISAKNVYDLTSHQIRTALRILRKV